ncbi:MAG: hypothetical protein NUV65_05745 [Candidatus Roizmanbacteria bacterium]|nr:hypothetical protein [Candidatus Roizmanbacteria bacterium]
MAKTQFTDSVGRTAWIDDNGYVYTENGKNPTYYTQDEWNSRQQSRWGGDTDSNKLLDEVSNTIIELEDKLFSLGVSISQEEADAFLQKAIEQVTPYYETKKTEIEAGIKEGNVQAAENVLVDIRRIKEEIGTTLQKLDIDQAQTEEEFVNTLANITSTKDEDIATKQYTWGERIKELKQTQVQTGVLTSGIGKQEVGGFQDRQQAELASVERSAGAAQTRLETGQKFDIERIALARKTVQTQRERQLGTQTQEDATTSGALGTLGLTGMDQLGSEAELQRQRAERNTQIYKPTALTDLGEEKSQAIESRKLTLQGETLDAKQQQEAAQRSKILSEISKQKAKIGVFS